MTEQNRSTRILELDGVRGIAILMVLIWHYFNNQVVPDPNTLVGYLHLATKVFWSGVDLFFVLSGFLIGGILLDNVESPVYYRTFYIRRVCRIFPAYFLVLGVAAIYGCRVYDCSVGDFIPYIFFIQNYTINDFPLPPLVGVTWSLAVEEQFYLIVPFLIRFGRSRIVPILLLLIVAAPICRSLLTNPHTWQWTIARGDSLLLGVLLAYLWEQTAFRVMVQKYRTVIFTLFVLLICGAGAVSYYSPVVGGVVNHSILGLLYAVLILIAVSDLSKNLSRALRVSPLRWLGERSYSIYLFHAGFAFIAHELVLKSWPAMNNLVGVVVTLGALMFTLLTSEVVYRFIEKPAISLGHKYRYRFRVQSKLATEITT